MWKIVCTFRKKNKICCGYLKGMGDEGENICFELKMGRREK